MHPKYLLTYLKTLQHLSDCFLFQ